MRPTLSDATAVFDHVLIESGSREAALYAAMRMFAVNRDGQVERTPTTVILEATCQHFGLQIGELLGGPPRGRRRVGRARQVAMALMCGAGESQAEAGAAVGRSRGAAEGACRHVERDDSLRAEAAAVAELVAARTGKPEELLPVLWPARQNLSDNLEGPFQVADDGSGLRGRRRQRKSLAQAATVLWNEKLSKRPESGVFRVSSSGRRSRL